jgi:uncharacterized protein (UPF0335 family)
LLRDFVSQLYDLKKEEASAKEDRKDLVEEMKAKDLPVAAMLALLKRDDEKVEGQLEAQRKAGAILGITVYTEVDEEELAVDEAEVIFAKDRINAIRETDADLERIKKEIKDKLAEVKSAGFVTKVVTLLVDFRLDPDKREAFSTNTLLVEKYLEACGT